MTVVNYFPLSVMKLGSMYTGTSEEHFCIDSKLIAVYCFVHVERNIVGKMDMGSLFWGLLCLMENLLLRI